MKGQWDLCSLSQVFGVCRFIVRKELKDAFTHLPAKTNTANSIMLTLRSKIEAYSRDELTFSLERRKCRYTVGMKRAKPSTFTFHVSVISCATQQLSHRFILFIAMRILIRCGIGQKLVNQWSLECMNNYRNI